MESRGTSKDVRDEGTGTYTSVNPTRKETLVTLSLSSFSLILRENERTQGSFVTSATPNWDLESY